MASSKLSSVANAVAADAACTIGAVLPYTLLVLLILIGTAAVAGAAGNGDAGALSIRRHILKYAGTVAKGVVGATGGVTAGIVAASTARTLVSKAIGFTAAEPAACAAAGVVAASTASTLALKAIGFTATGPAAGSYAAAWMSSTAIANGGAVAAGSLYSAVQATAMGGGLLLGAPAVLVAGAVAGAGVAVYKVCLWMNVPAVLTIVHK